MTALNLAAAYVLLAIGGALLIGGAIGLADRRLPGRRRADRPYPPAVPEPVRRIPREFYPPPIGPAHDWLWLAELPVDALSDDEVSDRFFGLVVDLNWRAEA